MAGVFPGHFVLRNSLRYYFNQIVIARLPIATTPRLFNFASASQLHANVFNVRFT